MDEKRISVVINTYNAEKYLEQVLQSVKDFDEILICDMHSTDSTIEISEKYGCRIVYHKKEKVVEPARNFAIGAATHNWILVLDADETIPPQLKEYLYGHLSKIHPEEGIRIPRKNYFMGKMMRGAYPDYNLRFFKKENVFWPAIIHTQPQVSGRVLKINKHSKGLYINHLANDSVNTILHKTNIYTDEEIPKRVDENITLFKLIFWPLTWFLKFYFLKKGCLDGKEGFIFASLKAHYKFVTLAKLYEYKKRKNNSDELGNCNL